MPGKPIRYEANSATAAITPKAPLPPKAAPGNANRSRPAPRGRLVRLMAGGAIRESVTLAGLAERAGLVGVEVTDQGGPDVPGIRQAGRDEEGGRGLELVAALAAKWGWWRRGGRTGDLVRAVLLTLLPDGARLCKRERTIRP